MKTKQQGFTLIELVVVIVLLGIIGAVATARFQNLAADARDATLTAIAGELSSASAINYAASQLGTVGFTPLLIGGGAAPDCDTATMDALLQSGLPAGYTVAVGVGACGTPGNVFTCTIGHPDTATTATATLLCTG